MNHTTFPAHGTWYSRYADLYVSAPTAEPEPASVTTLPTLPRLTPAA